MVISNKINAYLLIILIFPRIYIKKLLSKSNLHLTFIIKGYDSNIFKQSLCFSKVDIKYMVMKLRQDKQMFDVGYGLFDKLCT